MTNIATPPSTTLSTPSPTEADPIISQSKDPFEQHTTSSSNMAVSSSTTRPIYLIVATALSPPLGIGIRGNLPWPQIRTDMAFFRKATSGTSSSQSTSASPSSSRNVVLMGRKTWQSIPTKFRPLNGRLNVVLTRADTEGLQKFAGSVRDELSAKHGSSSITTGDSDSPRSEGSSAQWTTELRTVEEGSLVNVSSQGCVEVVVTNSLQIGASIDRYVDGVRDVFCIGGAEIYGMVLRDDTLRKRVRVLQTLVRKLDDGAFECDTFWPEDMQDGKIGWREVNAETAREWTGGVELPQGSDEWCRDEKAGVDIRVLGWERNSL